MSCYSNAFMDFWETLQGLRRMKLYNGWDGSISMAFIKVSLSNCRKETNIWSKKHFLKRCLFSLSPGNTFASAFMLTALASSSHLSLYFLRSSSSPFSTASSLMRTVMPVRPSNRSTTWVTLSSGKFAPRYPFEKAGSVIDDNLTPDAREAW